MLVPAYKGGASGCGPTVALGSVSSPAHLLAVLREKASLFGDSEVRRALRRPDEERNETAGPTSTPAEYYHRFSRLCRDDVGGPAGGVKRPLVSEVLVPSVARCGRAVACPRHVRNAPSNR